MAAAEDEGSRFMRDGRWSGWTVSILHPTPRTGHAPCPAPVSMCHRRRRAGRRQPGHRAGPHRPAAWRWSRPRRPARCRRCSTSATSASPKRRSTRCARWACCSTCARPPARSAASTSAAAAISAACVLDAAEHGREAFGQVVVARDFGEALEARLDDCTRVTRFRPMRFEGTSTGEGVRVLQSRDADRAMRASIEARLLVGADGTRSGVRDALGIGARRTRLPADPVRRARARRTARRTAPLTNASVRTGRRPCCRAATGISASCTACRATKPMPWPRWTKPRGSQRLQSAFGWRVGRLLSSGARSAYPIVQVRRASADRAARGAGRQCGADPASDRRAGLQPGLARCADAGGIDRSRRRSGRRRVACASTRGVARTIASARWNSPVGWRA